MTILWVRYFNFKLITLKILSFISRTAIGIVLYDDMDFVDVVCVILRSIFTVCW